MKVLVGIPSYQPSSVCTVALLQALNRKQAFLFKEEIGSLLTWNCNRLFTRALNLRKSEDLTHLLLMHSDVSPEQDDWFEVLKTEMEKAEADVLSAVIPIKDVSGSTSTALDIGPDRWKPVRLSQKQVASLPPTFTTDKLLLNTGLMLIDLRKPWVTSGIRFHIDDYVGQDEQGNWIARVASEDWNFSRDAAAAGACLYATTAVHLMHHGTAMWDSRAVYGAEQDQLHKSLNQEIVFTSPDGEMKVLKI